MTTDTTGERRGLRGLSAMVAGASGGIGTAVSTELARRGTDLTLAGRNIDRLNAVAVPGRRVAVDLRTPEGCAAAVRAATADGGRLDVMVNAVGVVAFGPVTELSPDVMEELFLTNTFVPILLARCALPEMDRGAVIVNISGVVAESNLPGMAAYGASKAAVRSFDEALAREARRVGVRVIDARPPHTQTGLATRALEGGPPAMPHGLAPADVATRICDAIELDLDDLPSTSF